MTKFGVMLEASRRMAVDRRLNKWTPFGKIIGQDAAVDALADLCFKGLGNDEHCVSESVVLVGPPSTGKTTIVKVMAEVLQITAVITDATQLPNADSVIDAILTEWAKAGVMLKPEWERDGIKMIRVPATIILVDEIHALTRKSQDGLLKATERADGMLFGKEYILDCRKVFWVGATTDWGKLCPAFRTRFRRIDLVPPTFDQVVQMVRQVMRMDEPTAREVVKFGGTVPRECFAFARAVVDASSRGGLSITAGIAEVARREQIDAYGMRIQRLRVLQALKAAGDGGCLLRTLVTASGCLQEELLGHWLPPMLIAPPGEMPLVMFDGRYFITPSGMRELSKRGL